MYDCRPLALPEIRGNGCRKKFVLYNYKTTTSPNFGIEVGIFWLNLVHYSWTALFFAFFALILLYRPFDTPWRATQGFGAWVVASIDLLLVYRPFDTSSVALPPPLGYGG